ncbi:MAG: HAMP domain-containing histidine kinase [Bacteroides sp.]|nr:HAMP domain-containing histidine kinase [Prevotella sp.]MCM1407569.1 HAMP domain-containing histidine kinase [Treponema brennaborense]MCM1469281.1 HAMP domain-containing histidine kinase [Bacteroides sp.]
MKHSIAGKLVFFFAAVLLIFAFITSSVFFTLFTKHTVRLYTFDLQERAVTIAHNLAVFAEQAMEEKKTPPQPPPPPAPGHEAKRYRLFFGNSSNYLFYLKNLREIAMTDVWIVNENLQVITDYEPGQMQIVPPRHNEGIKKRNPPDFKDLPPGADKVIKDAFTGKTVVTEIFNPILETKSLTIGTPVIHSNGTISAVLLLHSPVKGLHEAIASARNMFAISTAAALIIAGIAGIALSLSFTRPLKKMNTAALRLAEKNYRTRTGVFQKNEMGQLAHSIDTLAVRLAEAEAESGRLEKIRQDFFTNISHELRTPVTILRGSLETLCDGIITAPKEIRECHSQMLAETKHLQRLVNDMLELSRLQNNDFKIDMQLFDPAAAAEDAVRAIKRNAAIKNISVSLIKNGIPAAQIGDYGRIRQLFLIILDNAVKFSPENSEIRVEITEQKIRISDNGCGIPENDMPYIFDRFHKTNSRHNSAGSGLGLAIAKQIAERHHITLTCESPLHPGSENPGTAFDCIFS